MVVTRSMAGTTKKADTKVAGSHKVAERASKKTNSVIDLDLRNLACDLFVSKTFMPQFREKHPDVLFTLSKRMELGHAGAKEWFYMTDSDKAPYHAAVAEKNFDKETAYYKAYKKTAAEIASKKKTAKRKGLTANERYVIKEARHIFITETFIPQFLEKHPDVVYTSRTRFGAWNLGVKEWATMTDSDKAPYLAEAEKESAELTSHHELT